MTLSEIDTPKSIRNPKKKDWGKFRGELGDKLRYYNGVRVEDKDDLEVMAVMLDTSIGDSFISNCPEKMIQNERM